MKKILFETSLNKIYIISMIIITLLILGGYFSYAMFTVTKEKNNAISIVTGNLDYNLLIDGEEGNTLTVPSNSVKDFTVTLSNPNNRIARFNFYYIGNLDSHIKVGYIMTDGVNAPPNETGVNLEKVNTTGSNNTYTIRVINNSGSSTTINLGVEIGLDYNDLTLPENGHIFKEIIYKGEVGEVVLSNISKDNIYNDGVDTFTTGQYPNNYVWYSGKLWRVVLVNNESKTVKLVTQLNISTISYDNNSVSFAGSYMEEWLNDTTVDGFLGNLRDYESYIKLDSVWDAEPDDRALGEITRPEGTSVSTSAVGLLNIYEYQSSYHGTTYNKGYLVNGVRWWTLTPYNTSGICYVTEGGTTFNYGATWLDMNGIRPSINLKKEIKIVDGDGSEENPYRLEGDNDTNLEGTLLNTRYSGEYISFGTGENNLYRIVSHETLGLTKITSATILKENGSQKTIVFGDTSSYSDDNTIGTFLNGEYLTSGYYLTKEQVEMIEDNTTWYIGVGGYGNSYKLAKYTDTSGTILRTSTANAKVGLLRLGELMAGRQSSGYYFTLTRYIYGSYLCYIMNNGYGSSILSSGSSGIKPALNLKQNVIITSGNGTLQNPFRIELSE